MWGSNWFSVLDIFWTNTWIFANYIYSIKKEKEILYFDSSCEQLEKLIKQYAAKEWKTDCGWRNEMTM